MAMLSHAKDIFGTARLSCTKQAVKGWPQGSNALFKHAAIEMKQLNEPFLWLEPDAIPIKPGWLDAIANESATYPASIIGRNGVAVYPADIIDLAGNAINDRQAFDVSLDPLLEYRTRDTKLIQFCWGGIKLQPTFVEVRELHSPETVLKLSDLQPEAVLFHRNKDGTLIKLLRKRLFPSLCKVPFTVVMSFFNGDADQAHRTLEWIARLKTPKTHPILLCYETGVPSVMVAEIIKSAHKSFTSVHQSQYRRPPRGTFAPTMAFIHAANVMQKMGKPWLWMEPDTIPLKPDWKKVLQEEYDTCGKPFCGPIVPHRGHMNGTGLYPANTPELIPATMKATGSVWDWKMKDEMITSCHDCSRIFFHTWGVIDGKLNPIEGPDPNFREAGLINQIPDSAVIMHRCKDGSLIEELEKQLCLT